LDGDDMDRLNGISACQPGYPYDFIERLKRV
jgi:hypothetical protein